jgi:hypothetical protein
LVLRSARLAGWCSLFAEAWLVCTPLQQLLAFETISSSTCLALLGTNICLCTASFVQYPHVCTVVLQDLYTLWFAHLWDNIFSVREDSAVALGDAGGQMCSAAATLLMADQPPRHGNRQSC